MLIIEQTEEFKAWAKGLKDKNALKLVLNKTKHVALGNFGDSKAVDGAKGIHELRIHYGAGYCIYLTKIDNKIVFLLCGGIKRTQDKDIEQAKKLLKNLEV
ncbi:MAG: type II toxin-antitoxin system RelE/ParE family toxin [Spirochaetaceae bacterium]|nr:type II toxin-antitoxin system RelE/ParE family toxin [Spirochaetaceae bacterium]